MKRPRNVVELCARHLTAAGYEAALKEWFIAGCPSLDFSGVDWEAIQNKMCNIMFKKNMIIRWLFQGEPG